jgi:hypothetical protein
MKASQFVEILRKVIREEVRSVVKEELKSLKPLLKESKPVVAPKPVVQQRPAPKRTQPLVTIEGALGDILRETAESMRGQNVEDDWIDMNGGPMTTADVNTFAMNSFTPQEESRPVQPKFNFSGDPTMAFVKDYSKVLKQADQLAQNYRG